MQEIWLDISGYEGLYQVSNKGRVKRVCKTIPGGRLLKPLEDKDGYFKVQLCKCNKVTNYRVHRLVAAAFIENPHNYPVVNHKDENPKNNSVDNLEWCSVKYNTRYNNAHLKKSDKTSKPILQLSVAGQVIKEWANRREIEAELGYSGGNITACCCNYAHRKTAYGYKWAYAQKGGADNG